MIKLLIISLSMMFLSSCSFKPKPNAWQYKSADYFALYSKNFLKDNQLLAKNDLMQAIKYAKKSGNLTTLATLYLGECALNISVGINDTCKKYQDISEVVRNNELDAYYSLLTKHLTPQQIQLLPQEYQLFLKKSRVIFEAKKITSIFLYAALRKEKLDSKTRKKLIDLASFYGYKRVVLFWLHEHKKYTENQNEWETLEKKISILKD